MAALNGEIKAKANISTQGVRVETLTPECWAWFICFTRHSSSLRSESFRRGCPRGLFECFLRVPQRPPEARARKVLDMFFIESERAGAAFFWVLFFCCRKKSTSPARRNNALRVEHQFRKQEIMNPENIKRKSAAGRNKPRRVKYQIRSQKTKTEINPPPLVMTKPVHAVQWR